MRKNSLLKKLFILGLVGAGIFASLRTYHHLTDDFRLSNIREELSYRKEWETTPLSMRERESLKKIFKQPFTYLSKGAQSYVFASEDGKYVLKFFKFKHARPRLLVTLMPSVSYLKDYKKRHIGKKWRKMLGPFQGYALADKRLRRESGLLAVHLNRTKGLYPTVELRDKLGITRRVNLDEVVFVVQERAIAANEEIPRLIESGRIAEAKARIEQLKNMLRYEYRLKIGDRDRYILKNVGFVGERAIRMDLGMLYYDAGISDPEYELKRFKIEWSRWVNSHYPEYAEALL